MGEDVGHDGDNTSSCFGNIWIGSNFCAEFLFLGIELVQMQSVSYLVVTVILADLKCLDTLGYGIKILCKQLQFVQSFCRSPWGLVEHLGRHRFGGR